MRIATVDIGTNTILMLIADVASDGSLSVVQDEQVIARLGRGVDEHRQITKDAFNRVKQFLEEYQRIASSHRVEKIIAVGTSALRDAANAAEFIDFIRRNTGLRIEVLSGHQEAEYTYQGAVSEFLVGDDQQEFAVLDIGGGSTELSIGVDNNLVSRESFDIGCVRLTERFLKNSPPSSEGLEGALGEVSTWTSTLHRISPQIRLLGVAGTVTTLAAMDLRLAKYDPERVGGHHLSIETITRLTRELQPLSVSEMIRKFPQIQEGRADIILAGMLILMEFMKALGAGEILASDRGLRYGIAYNEHLNRS